jgi:hypothetical protein
MPGDPAAPVVYSTRAGNESSFLQAAHQNDFFRKMRPCETDRHCRSPS